MMKHYTLLAGVLAILCVLSICWTVSVRPPAEWMGLGIPMFLLAAACTASAASTGIFLRPVKVGWVVERRHVMGSWVPGSAVDTPFVSVPMIWQPGEAYLLVLKDGDDRRGEVQVDEATYDRYEEGSFYPM